MSCYFIAQIKIFDRELCQEYIDRFDDIFVNYKGKVIAVEDQRIVLGGEWNYTRLVLIRFPCFQTRSAIFSKLRT
jgi:uncharacterized protein (DUF1330 family)